MYSWLSTLHSNIPSIDTTSMVTVLTSVIGLAIVAIVVLWRVISRLADDKDKLNAARVQDSKDHAAKLTALLRDNFEVQESTAAAMNEGTHQAEKLQLSIDSLRENIKSLGH